MRRKLERFEEISQRHNVLEIGKDRFETIKGKWNEVQFPKAQELVLELACGRGEYSVGLAAKFPNKNFIGVDIKGDRIWKGSSWALEQGLENVAFLRTQIHFLERFFEPGEVSDIWILFPDPRPKERDEKRRLTSPRFLEIYRNIIKKEGWIRLKTDNTELFTYTLEQIQKRKDIINCEFTWDLYASDLLSEHHDIRTRYELKFTEKGSKIKYLKFQFDSISEKN